MKKKTAILSLTLFLTLLLAVPSFAANVCKIGSKGYASLQDAVNHVKTEKPSK
ncbi:MAG: hypothetical protein IIZ39_14295 [Blautia sp.]|nr:hypothetical protein [Blautia sp.]